MEQTTTQALFTVGMPTLAVLVGILVNNSRLSDLRGHMDTSIGALRNEMTQSIGAFREEVNRLLDGVDRRLDRIEDLLSKHDSRITVLEERTNPLRSVR